MLIVKLFKCILLVSTLVLHAAVLHAGTTTSNASSSASSDYNETFNLSSPNGPKLFFESLSKEMQEIVSDMHVPGWTHRQMMEILKDFFSINRIKDDAITFKHEFAQYLNSILDT